MNKKDDQDSTGFPDDVADSTRRAKEFRKRMADQELSRWEIFASDETKNRVREIAYQEGTSAGIVAEALLRLGIDAYQSSRAVAQAAPAVHAFSMSASNASAKAAQEMLNLSSTPHSGLEAQGARGPSAVLAQPLGGRSLLSYSSRTSSTTTPATSRLDRPSDQGDPAKSSAINNFFAQAKKRSHSGSDK